MRERARHVTIGGLVAALLLSATSVAEAGLGDTFAATTSYGTGVLAPVTGLSAAAGPCSWSGDKTVLTWTASASPWADGYEVARSTASGGPHTVIATVAGGASVSYTDSPPSFSTTYYYAVRATKHGWRSSDATVSRRTKSALCL